MRTDPIKTDDLGVFLRLLMPANRLAFETCLQTGLRISDVLSLKTADLKQRMTVTEQKTGKKQRVYISKKLLERLQAASGTVWVFPNCRDPVNRHRCRQTVYKDVKRAAKALRVEYNAGCHSSRKLFAVDLYRRSGFDAVQKALNHDNPATTMIYLASELLCR